MFTAAGPQQRDEEAHTQHPPQLGDDLPTLTVLRGLAALAVFFTHGFGLLLLASADANATLVRLSLGLGEGAVTCFFVMSGFILVWVAPSRDSMRAFWRRRAARIGPNHVVTWVAGLLLLIWAGRTFNPLALLPSLTLVHVWLPHPAVLQGTNAPAWTLACEAFFYLCFPLLLVRLRRLTDDRLRRAAWWSFGAIVVWTLLVGALVPSEPRAADGLPVPVAQMYAIVFVPPLRLLDFWLGMTVAELVRRRAWPELPHWAPVAGLIGAYGASVLLPAPLGYVAPWVAASALLIGAAGTGAWRRAPRLLIRLGEVSFAFYLVHWLVLQFALEPTGLERKAATPAQLVAYLAAALVASLTLASLLRRVVEIPAARALRQRRARASDPHADPLDALAATLSAMTPPAAPAPPQLPSPMAAGQVLPARSESPSAGSAAVERSPID